MSDKPAPLSSSPRQVPQLGWAGGTKKELSSAKKTLRLSADLQRLRVFSWEKKLAITTDERSIEQVYSPTRTRSSDFSDLSLAHGGVKIKKRAIRHTAAGKKEEKQKKSLELPNWKKKRTSQVQYARRGSRGENPPERRTKSHGETLLLPTH